MSKEILILFISWVVSIITILAISKGRARLAQISFLFTQALAWLFEFCLVYFDLVEFPYREFKIATHMSFSLYYVIFPTVGVLFILFYPRDASLLKIFLYYLFFAMIVPTYASIAEAHSNLFRFINWNWSMHVFADLIIFYILKKFVFWFQRGLVDQ